MTSDIFLFFREIKSRANQHLVLTVSMPATSCDQPVALTFNGSYVNLQQRRTNQFGKAHQRWRYDAESGLLRAFSAELPDKGDGLLLND